MTAEKKKKMERAIALYERVGNWEVVWNALGMNRRSFFYLLKQYRGKRESSNGEMCRHV